MTPEEIKKALQDYSDFTTRESKHIPVAWVVETALDMLAEAESGKIPVDFDVSGQMNAKLHEAEAKLDARLARIKRAQEVIKTGFEAALDIVIGRLLRQA